MMTMQEMYETMRERIGRCGPSRTMFGGCRYRGDGGAAQEVADGSSNYWPIIRRMDEVARRFGLEVPA